MNKQILMHLIDVPTNVCKGFVILGTLVLCLKKTLLSKQLCYPSLMNLLLHFLHFTLYLNECL